MTPIIAPFLIENVKLYRNGTVNIQFDLALVVTWRHSCRLKHLESGYISSFRGMQLICRKPDIFNLILKGFWVGFSRRLIKMGHFGTQMIWLQNYLKIMRVHEEFMGDKEDNPWNRTPFESKTKNDLKTNWF